MTEKKKKQKDKFTIEELYQNKNFVPPKEKNLETIFEEPRKSKDGAPILTSVRKYKRYLHFDPTEGKIHKRKLKAKKCIGNTKVRNKLRTRSSKIQPQCKDISVYIMEAMGESSDSEGEATNEEVNKESEMTQNNATNNSEQELKKSLEPNTCDTQDVEMSSQQNISDEQGSTPIIVKTDCDAETGNVGDAAHNDTEAMSSPRSSCVMT